MRKIFIFLLILLCHTALGQKKGSSTNKQAQKTYETASQSISYKFYDKALEQLKEAVAIDDKFIAAYQQMGDVYRKLSDYKNAMISYRHVIELDPEFLPLTYFGLGESELNSGDYANALKHLEKYATYPLQESSKKLVDKLIADCRFSLNAIKNPVNFEPANMGASINTKEQEYLPVVTADEKLLIFTRQANRNEDFYRSIRSDDQWSQSEPLSEAINTKIYNEGAQCISPDGMYMFFTGCNRPDGLGRCDIYLSKREGKNWSAPFNIGGPVNTPGWESQPSLTADGKTLYFVSTRPGGYGGYDIWKSDLKSDGSWTVPLNLGPNINTPGTVEEAPTFYEDDEGREVMLFSRRSPVAFTGAGGKIYQSVGGAPATLVAGGPNGVSSGGDNRPSVTHDGRTIFWDSFRTGSLGGPDIWYATRSNTSEPWGQAIQLSQLNSEANDTRPYVSWDGHTLIISAANDIWFSTRE